MGRLAAALKMMVASRLALNPLRAKLPAQGHASQRETRLAQTINVG
jgi:hypothetical protein